MKVKCRVIKSGTSGYYNVDDVAECIGPILYKWIEILISFFLYES